MLVEVVIALAIVAMAFAYAFPSLSSSLDRMRRDHLSAEAVALAQSTLDRLGADLPLQVGEREGRTEDGFAWQVAVAPYTGVAVPANAGVAGLTVVVTVAWQERARVRQVSLATVRLVHPVAAR